jgi:8-oxo-dGTP pyrophosphatase MutT (NUDIX family)
MVQAAVRETKEETGVDCEITGVVGIYTGPKHVLLYASNGEVRQEFSIVLTARATGGVPTPSPESSEVKPCRGLGPDVFFGDRAVDPLGDGDHAASAFELSDDAGPLP